MIVIPSSNSVWFDCDDTLIMWNPSPEKIEKHGITVISQSSMELDADGQVVNKGNWSTVVVPHRKHVEQLIKHKERGHTVVVWSAGGYDWALATVKALKLEQYVDLVISKPMWIYDDLSPSEFMPTQQYLKDYDD